jgi:hypothetical protein
MDIYTVYIDLREGASPDDYSPAINAERVQDRPNHSRRPNTGIFLALVFPLPLIPLREHIERRIKESMKPDHPIVEVIVVE